MMVSMAVLSLILIVMFQITSNTSKLWQHTRARIDTFQESRGAFETVTKNLSQAMMNTYWDYVNAAHDSRVDLARKSTSLGTAKAFSPDSYRRQSELEFMSGVSNSLLSGVSSTGSGGFSTVGSAIFFQAPLGIKDPKVTGDPASDTSLSALLNSCGYFLEYADDSKDRPNFLIGKNPKPRSRLRLMELRQPSEKMAVYSNLGASSVNWFVTALNETKGSRLVNRHVVAENIIAMALIPKRSPGDQALDPATDPLAVNYSYDSRAYLTDRTNPRALLMCNQLPPMVHVIIVAIDEKSAARLEDEGRSPIT
ncbi:MAG: Verru_Chthon cassette protein C, partial [Bradyrhizobium sp.]